MSVFYVLAIKLLLISHSIQDDNNFKQLLARENIILMGTLGACHLPLPQVVYPNVTLNDSMNKYYIPRGFILHQCSHLSGHFKCLYNLIVSLL